MHSRKLSANKRLNASIISDLAWAKEHSGIRTLWVSEYDDEPEFVDVVNGSTGEVYVVKQPRNDVMRALSSLDFLYDEDGPTAQRAAEAEEALTKQVEETSTKISQIVNYFQKGKFGQALDPRFPRDIDKAINPVLKLGQKIRPTSNNLANLMRVLREIRLKEQNWPRYVEFTEDFLERIEVAALGLDTFKLF